MDCLKDSIKDVDDDDDIDRNSNNAIIIVRAI